MNLNFHLVDIRSDFSKPQAMDLDAKAALLKDTPSVTDMRAVAELLDWEQSSALPSTLLGQRCKKAIGQWANCGALRSKLEQLSSASPSVKAALVRKAQVLRLAA